MDNRGGESPPRSFLGQGSPSRTGVIRLTERRSKAKAMQLHKARLFSHHQQLPMRVGLNATLAAINGQPPSDTLERIRQAGGDVLLILQAELDEEVAKANALISRFTRWELAIPPGLANSVALANFVLEHAN